MSYDSFKPGALWLDNNGVHINAHGGGVLHHGDVYYWFGEHKIKGRAGNRAHVGVHVYSSSDLYNWHDEGIALAVSDDPESPIVKESTIERPKVIYCANTDTFVMWFHLELKDQGYSAALCATAVSDTPTGPYRFVEAFRPNAGIWPINVTEADKVEALDGRKRAFSKRTRACRNTPFKKGHARVEMVFGHLLSNGRQHVGAF